MSSNDSPQPLLQFSVPSLGFDESKGPPTFKFVFFELPLDKFPYRFPETAGFFITNCWVGAAGEFQQRLVIRCGEDVVVDAAPRPFLLEDARVPYMAVTFVQGVEFPRAGDYDVEIFLDQKSVMTYPLRVCQAPGE